jgi:predicted ester cyclase
MGPFMGFAPSGREATVTGVEIFRVQNGQVAEFWHHDDLFSLVQQLGLFVPKGSPESPA